MRIINVIRAVVMLMLINARVAPSIRWISKCPAVILAISCMASAIGLINRLIFSVITNNGIRGTGVPCG